MSIHRLALVALAATTLSASVIAQTVAIGGPAPTDAVAASPKSSTPAFRAMLGHSAPVIAPRSELEPRTPIDKIPSSQLEIPITRRSGESAATGRVLVKFNDDVRARSTRTPGFVLQTADGATLSSATGALASTGGGLVWQAIDKSPEWLSDLQFRAEERSGEASADLAGLVYVVPSNDDLVACARAFNELPEVEFVVIEQAPSQAQQVGAQTGCGSAPGTGCQNPPGSVNCNKPAITTPLLGPPPNGRCTNVINGSVCSNDCEEPCVAGVDNRNCMKGCNDATCCGAIVAILPACTADFGGWSGLCALYANSMCNRTVYDNFLVVNGNNNSVPGSFKYDPCFALRTGPNPGAPDASVQAGYMSTMGLPGAVNFPFELVRVTAFSTAVVPAPFGTSGLVSGVAATLTNPAFLSSAKLAMQDPSFERATYQTTPTCLTIHPGRKGCSNTPCCVYVCLVDPSCCINAWDANCVRIAASTNVDNPCVQPLAGSIAASVTPGPADMPSINMANFPTGGATPNFASTEVTTGFGKQARNLQAWAVGAPVASSLEQLESDPAVGLFAVAAPTTTAQLASSRMFLNSGFRGGGLDLAGFQNAAVALGIDPAAPQGNGITIGVIDNAAFVNHEELVGKVTVEPGVQVVTDPAANVDPNHGTAVLGILLAKEDGKGITGAAPLSKGIFFPAVGGGGVGGRFFNALATAVGTLKAGDVICIPMDFPTVITDPLTGQVTILQGTVLSSPEVFMLANTASQIGIAVVVAAGNECSPVVTSPAGQEAGPSIVVGACWPGAPRLPAVFEGLRYCRSEFSNFTDGGGAAGEDEVDVAGWGAYVTTCGYGDLWRGGGSTNQLRTYTYQFGGTSASSAMVAACVARMQGLATALFGTPLPTAAIKNTVRANVRPQCGLPETSPLQLTSSDACAGDTIVGGGDFNSIRGFIDMSAAMASSLANQPFGSLPPGVANYEVQVLVGKLLAGSAFSLRANDSVWMRILSARPGSSTTTGPGFGPALFYPPTALLTDLMITITTTFTKPEQLFGLSVTAAGQAQPISNVYTIYFVYNVQTRRWLMLPDTLLFFSDTDEPEPDGDVPINSGEIGNLYNVINLMDLSSGAGKIRVRAVTIAPPIQNSYQAWWDLISVVPNPPPQPPPPCWVARAVYGTATPHWILYREWLDHRAPESFRNAYLAFGEPISKWVAKSPTAKALIRPMLDAAVRQLSEAETARALSRFVHTEEGRRLQDAISAIKANIQEESLP